MSGLESQVPDKEPVMLAFESKEQMDKYHNAMHHLCEFVVKAAKRGAFTEDEMPDILNFYDTVYNGKKSFGD